MNELMNYDIILHPAEIEFHNYEQLKASAMKLAERVSQVEVTEDNVKESKKLLASVNNEMKNINQRRIGIKKELLKPYSEMEAKIKDVESIINEANSIVKSQIDEIAEQERQEKYREIETLFNRRVKHYVTINELFEPDDFIQNKHLNKSTSISKVESEMIEWLENVKRDIDTIVNMTDSEDILVEYVDTVNLSTAIHVIQQRKKATEEISNQVAQSTNKSIKKEDVTFTVSQRDRKFVELLLKENEINYTIQK